jgi:VanZ family protein
MPVGACAYLTFRLRWGRVLAALGAVLLGTSLSTCIEIAQEFVVSRSSSIYDVYANAAGSAAGVALGAVYLRLSGLLNRRLKLPRPDRSALILIVFWLGYLFFPFVPVLGVNAIQAKLPHLHAFAWMTFVGAVLAWFVIGHALRAAGVRKAWIVCLASVLLVPAQLLIHHRQPTLGEFAGGVAGALLFHFTQDWKNAIRFAAVATTCFLIFSGLQPMELTPEPQAFNWVPFASMLGMDWYQASDILFTKVFFYGAAIWSLRTSGLKLSTAALGMAAVLLLLEIAQIWLTRTPEITDPLMALLIGIGFDAFDAKPRRISSLSGTSA